MASVFSATGRAPVTAILLLFEMTRYYHMILPLMFFSVISILVAESISGESIFTIKLKAEGIDLKSLESENVLLI